MHFMAVWNICEDILSDWLYNRTEVHAAGDAGHLKIHSFQHTIFLWVDVGENFECRAKSDIMTLVIRFGLAPMARACPTAHHTVLGFTIPISTPKIHSTPMPEGIIITRYAFVMSRIWSHSLREMQSHPQEVSSIVPACGRRARKFWDSIERSWPCIN